MRRSFSLAILLVAVLLVPSSQVMATHTGFDFTVNSTDDQHDAVTGDPACETTDGGGECTLRAAIEQANWNEGGSGKNHWRISLPAGTYNLSLGELPINTTTTIVGAGSGTTEIVGPCPDGGGAAAGSFTPSVVAACGVGRVFHVIAASISLTLEGLTVRGGNDSPGGGISVMGFQSDLIGTDLVVTQNTSGANNTGGGIYATVGENSLTLTDSEVSSNTTSGNGGGIYWSSGIITLTRVLIDNNHSDQHGGGMYTSAPGPHPFEDVQFTNNTAGIVGAPAVGGTDPSGGGLYAVDAGFDVVINMTEGSAQNSQFSSNGAQGYGGGAYVGGGATLNISDTLIDNNEAMEGGGVWLGEFDVVDVNSSLIQNNTAYAGAGFYNEHGTLTIDGSILLDNEAQQAGGGIWTNGTTSVTGGSITSNSIVPPPEGKAYAGAGIAAYGGNVDLTGVTVNNNSVPDGVGGGIYTGVNQVAGTHLTMDGSDLLNNTAQSGAGLYMGPSDYAEINDADISDNTAELDGGGIWSAGTLLLTDSTVARNEAGDQGGGIYGTSLLIVLAQANRTPSAHSIGQLTDLTGVVIRDNTAIGDGGGGWFGNNTTTTAVETEVRDNTAANHGGGFYLGAAELTARRTTFAGNVAGAVGSSGNGGGLWTAENSFTDLTNTTISFNSAVDGGGMWNLGVARFAHVTVAVNTATDGDSGGIYTGAVAASTVDMDHALLGVNTPDNCDSAGGASFVSVGNNMADDDTCFADAGTDSVVPNIGISPLTNNGGPTRTHALLISSPALDAGAASCVDVDAAALTVDQRNKVRPKDGDQDGTTACDIGAFEFQGVAIEELAGPTRIETAIEVAGRQYESSPIVIIARWDLYPDALAGGPLAYHLDAPILLTYSHWLLSDVAKEIRRLGATEAIILGGEVAIQPGVVQQLLDQTDVTTVTRFDGEDRFETAALIAEFLLDWIEMEAAPSSITPSSHNAGGPSVYIAEGSNIDPNRGWPDPMAVGYLAAFEEHPILLVKANELPGFTSQSLIDNSVASATIVGGPVAVSAGVETLIDAIVADVDRLSGATRYDTSGLIGDRAVDLGMSPATLWVTSGLNWPDGLVAGPVVAQNGDILVLVHPTLLQLSPEIQAWILDHKEDIGTVVFLGGTAAISQTVRDQIYALFG